MVSKLPSVVAGDRPRLAYLAPELGGLSSTFVYREIFALEKIGHEVIPFSTTYPQDGNISIEAREIVSRTTYLYQTPYRDLARSFFINLVSTPKSAIRGLLWFLSDIFLDPSISFANRIRLPWQFLVGAHLASSLRSKRVDHLHIHFAHAPTTVGMYAARIAGCTFSFTAHANDIFERPTLLKTKLDRADAAITISEYNKTILETFSSKPNRIEVIRCGIDFEEFRFRERSDQQWLRPRIVSVARLVEKKGLIYLLEALSILDKDGVSYKCHIIGGGPLHGELEAYIKDRGLERNVFLEGPQDQEQVRTSLHEATVFTLPCIETASGDRDGIPVSLMEAIAIGVPVVSTLCSGIPELIANGETGLLVPQRDASELAAALRQLIRDPERGNQMAENANKRIRHEFSLTKNVESKLARVFNETWQNLNVL